MMKLPIRFALVLAGALVFMPVPHGGAARTTVAAPVAMPDLSITVTFNQPKSYENIHMGIVVHNRGTADATGVTVKHSGMPTISSYWPCDGAADPTCRLWTISAGGSQSYTLYGRAPEAGTLTLTSVVTADQGDANDADNTNHSSVTVEPGPFTDLVMHEETAFPAVSPGVVSFRLSVRNEGSELVKLARAFGRPYPFVTTSAVASQGKCSVASTQLGWDCLLGPLLPGARAEIVVVATLTQITTAAFQSETRVDHGAVVISEVPDPNLDNNGLRSAAYATVLGVDGSVVPPLPPVPAVPWSSVPWHLIPDLPDLPEIGCRVLVVNRCFKYM